MTATHSNMRDSHWPFQAISPKFSAISDHCCKIYFLMLLLFPLGDTLLLIFNKKDSQIYQSFCTISSDGDLWFHEQKALPQWQVPSTSASRSFQVIPTLAIQGFALWRDRALRSPEIAIAHLSQGLRSSSYHRKRGSFEFLSLQCGWRSWCVVNIEV